MRNSICVITLVSVILMGIPGCEVIKESFNDDHNEIITTVSIVSTNFDGTVVTNFYPVWGNVDDVLEDNEEVEE